MLHSCVSFLTTCNQRTELAWFTCILCSRSLQAAIIMFAGLHSHQRFGRESLFITFKLAELIFLDFVTASPGLLLVLEWSHSPHSRGISPGWPLRLSSVLPLGVPTTLCTHPIRALSALDWRDWFNCACLFLPLPHIHTDGATLLFFPQPPVLSYFVSMNSPSGPTKTE